VRVAGAAGPEAESPSEDADETAEELSPLSMPTYDYVCNACGTSSRPSSRSASPRSGSARSCGKPKLERRIGPGAGILFKGGGFYQTDYRSESYKQGESSEKGDSKPAETKSDPAPAKTPKSAGAKSSKTKD
jgi:putative FmdB family regulatory protein